MKLIKVQPFKFFTGQVIKLMRPGEDVRVGIITDTTRDTLFVQFGPGHIEELSLEFDRKNIQLIRQAGNPATQDRIVILHGNEVGLINNQPMEADKLWSKVNAALKIKSARKLAQTDEVIMYAITRTN